MSWFGKKSTSDTKARIEELKKKIQAEQTAYAQSVAAPAAPAAPPPPPAETISYAPPPVAQPTALPPAPSPFPTTAPPAPVAAPAPQPAVREIIQPIEFAPREFPRPHHASRHDSRHDSRHERAAPAERGERMSLERPQTDSVWHAPGTHASGTHAPRHHAADQDMNAGVILDLGEGMSLNLPIRSRMQLDEFLVVAQRVRELQRLERTR